LTFTLPPIEDCAREACSEKFFKTRKDRRFCTEHCARLQWYEDVTAGKRLPKKRGVSDAKAEAVEA
jgi:hypothetical protein